MEYPRQTISISINKPLSKYKHICVTEHNSKLKAKLKARFGKTNKLALFGNDF
jgi:hypothetical protein